MNIQDALDLSLNEEAFRIIGNANGLALQGHPVGGVDEQSNGKKEAHGAA